MRLWLDDIREPWKYGFILSEWAHTADEAIAMLKTGEVTYASLDHDLQPEHYSNHCGDDCGCAVVNWMEANNVWPVDGVLVHSQNESARLKMEQGIDKHYGEGYSRRENFRKVAQFIEDVKSGKI